MTFVAGQLLRHVLESLLEVLLAEGQLADGPDLGVGLQGLLVLVVEGTGLDGNDGRGGFGVVGNGRAAVATEDAVHRLARAADTGPALGGALNLELLLQGNEDESCTVSKGARTS